VLLDWCLAVCCGYRKTIAEPGCLQTPPWNELLVAGDRILDVLDDPVRRADALDRLVAMAKGGITGFSGFSALQFHRFEAAEDRFANALAPYRLFELERGSRLTATRR
jgi:hypothetical protein